VSDPDLAVRRTVAQEHGLPTGAIKFLSGDTVEELEQSASALAQLVEERREQHEHDARLQAPSGVFERAAMEKAQRKKALLAALTGRAPRRDPAGRFAAPDERPAIGFGGGARQPPPPQPQTHESWLADALADRRADVGRAL
jgi:hypothetical protein